MIGCGEKEKQSQVGENTNENQKSTEPDSTAIRPIDLNNTLFMYHFETTQMLDSVFYASQDQMQGIYEILLFDINIKIHDLQNMEFTFKGANSFISSAEEMMKKYYSLMKNDFPPIMDLLVLKRPLNDDEKSIIKEFEEKFDRQIRPVAEVFFQEQEKFAHLHKIELVGYE